jgi:hypothetical protein
MAIVTHAYRPKRLRKRKAQATEITGPSIITAKNPRRRVHPDVPDMTPEDYQQRGDAADALWRELVRRV